MMFERELCLEGAELSKEQVLKGLREMEPRSNTERLLIEATVQYVTAVLKSGRVTTDNSGPGQTVGL